MDDGEFSHKLHKQAHYQVIKLFVGHSVCPGYELANVELWISMATILSTIKISQVKDANGDDIVPKVQGRSSILR